MVILRNRLPPANSLVTFEAAARHLNFTRAAAELSVTQAAVSRQVQLLEDNLGQRLFERQPRGLLLTAAGERLFAAVTMGLGHIATTAADLRRVRREGELTVSTSVTFANYWLMSRVAKFRAAHPEIQLRLVASAPVRDLTASGIDLAVRYGRGRWAGAEALHLLDNHVFPVCAPAYMARRRPLQSVTDLLEETLLHLVEFDRNWVSWEAWLEALGVSAPPRGPSLEFDPGGAGRPRHRAGRRPPGRGLPCARRPHPPHRGDAAFGAVVLPAGSHRPAAHAAGRCLSRLDPGRGEGKDSVRKPQVHVSWRASWSRV